MGYPYDRRVASIALGEWKTERQRRLAQAWFFAATARGGVGQNWRLDQAHSLLVVRLTAEFQGFARDLHDEASDYMSTAVARGNAPLETTLRTRFTTGRKVDVGNPNPGALGTDFGYLGLVLWSALQTHDARASDWNNALDQLMAARNAIAHSDEAKLAGLKANGFKINKTQLKKSEQALDRLATAMDRVVGAYLGRLLGGAPPW